MSALDDYLSDMERGEGMKGMQHDMDLAEIYAPRDESPTDSSLYDYDDYMEEEIMCSRCGRAGPRYKIEGHSCGEAA